MLFQVNILNRLMTSQGKFCFICEVTRVFFRNTVFMNIFTFIIFEHLTFKKENIGFVKTNNV